jgi:hypothetical protein
MLSLLSQGDTPRLAKRCAGSCQWQPAGELWRCWCPAAVTATGACGHVGGTTLHAGAACGSYGLHAAQVAALPCMAHHWPAFYHLLHSQSWHLLPQHLQHQAGVTLTPDTCCPAPPPPPPRELHVSHHAIPCLAPAALPPGELHLSLRYRPFLDLASVQLHPVRARGVLLVSVRGCRKLVAGDWDGGTDPYVLLKVSQARPGCGRRCAEVVQALASQLVLVQVASAAAGGRALASQLLLLVPVTLGGSAGYR